MAEIEFMMDERAKAVIPEVVKTLYRLDPNSDLENMFAGRERQTYKEVLENSRRKCPEGTHVMTLSDYMSIWRSYFNDVIISCALSNVSRSSPTPQTPHIFDFPILVDTHLTKWDMQGINYETLSAEVIERGDSKGRVTIPPFGKIYELNEFGLPSKTGGEKITSSEPFIHTWWAFSMHKIIEPTEQGRIKRDFDMAIFANGGIMGCFYEFLKAHYSMNDREGFYQVLSFPD